MAERDEVRRAARRSSAENSKLERDRDEARKAANRLKVSCVRAHDTGYTLAPSCKTDDVPWQNIAGATITTSHLYSCHTQTRELLLLLCWLCLSTTQAQLDDVRRVELVELEARHKEASAKLSSEVQRLKQALKEAEAAAAAAQATAAASSTQPKLQAQLQEAHGECAR